MLVVVGKILFGGNVELSDVNFTELELRGIRRYSLQLVLDSVQQAH